MDLFCLFLFCASQDSKLMTRSTKASRMLGVMKMKSIGGWNYKVEQCWLWSPCSLSFFISLCWCDLHTLLSPTLFLSLSLPPFLSSLSVGVPLVMKVTTPRTRWYCWGLAKGQWRTSESFARRTTQSMAYSEWCVVTSSIGRLLALMYKLDYT